MGSGVRSVSVVNNCRWRARRTVDREGKYIEPVVGADHIMELLRFDALCQIAPPRVEKHRRHVSGCDFVGWIMDHDPPFTLKPALPRMADTAMKSLRCLVR